MQSVKGALKRVVSRAILSFNEIQTVLLEIEAILNSRPLCTLFDDDMEEPLTPNHLLFGRRLNQRNVEHFNVEVNVNIGSKRALYVESVVQHFWDRWRKEYVTSLRNWKQKYKKIIIYYKLK